MESNVVSIRDLGQGFTIEQLENEAGHIFYRMCSGSVCRYCEDEYMAYMYAEGAGWDRLLLADP
jgi:hypothetical protein